MSFVDMPSVQSQHSALRISVALDRRHQKGKYETVALRANIGVGALERAGFEIGMRVSAQWGEQSDAGKIRLVPVREGERGFKLGRVNKGARGGCRRNGLITCGNLPTHPLRGTGCVLWTLRLETWGALAAEWEAAPGLITITLPRHWWHVAESRKTRYAQDPAILDQPTQAQLLARREIEAEQRRAKLRSVA